MGGGGLFVYLCGGGAGPSGTPFAPFVLGAFSVTGLEGAGEDESTSMGCGVGWSLMANMAEDSLWRSSGGRFSGCESRSYLDERLDE